MFKEESMHKLILFLLNGVCVCVCVCASSVVSDSLLPYGL